MRARARARARVRVRAGFRVRVRVRVRLPGSSQGSVEDPRRRPRAPSSGRYRGDIGEIWGRYGEI